MRVHPRLVVAVVAVAGAGLALAPAASAAPHMSTSAASRVVSVVDGDTVRLENGQTVRIIGMDTPEQGKCGSVSATTLMKKLVLGKTVTVTNPQSVKDTDKYGRALRAISVNGKDVGKSMIGSGWANARYDQLNGYQWHFQQSTYRYTDKVVHHKCGTAVDKVGEPTTRTATTSTAAATGSEPWNSPGPDLDCSDIRKVVRITGPDYHNLDADGDGWGCESWG